MAFHLKMAFKHRGSVSANVCAVSPQLPTVRTKLRLSVFAKITLALMGSAALLSHLHTLTLGNLMEANYMGTRLWEAQNKSLSESPDRKLS